MQNAFQHQPTAPTGNLSTIFLVRPKSTKKFHESSMCAPFHVWHTESLSVGVADARSANYFSIEVSLPQRTHTQTDTYSQLN